MLVGQYHMVAFALNSLGVELDEGLEPLPETLRSARSSSRCTASSEAFGIRSGTSRDFSPLIAASSAAE